MRKLSILVVLIFGLVYAAVERPDLLKTFRVADLFQSGSVSDAYRQHESNVRVSGTGKVTKVLADDSIGSRHQRFILRLDSGQTVLVVHNIDLAPRVQSIRTGDTVEFQGEYIWNPQGGMVHWTHHDPSGKHAAGWLKHNERTYR